MRSTTVHPTRWGLLAARVLALMALTALLGAGLAGRALAKDYLIGEQCDRSGPTQNVGPYVCDGFDDYVKLMNSKHVMGPGNQITVLEIDHSYDVPKAIESFERHRAAGALSIALFGTPQTVALAPKLAQYHIPGTSPGFGSAAARNGEKFPYLFPIAASYWSQAAASVKFVMDNWKKDPKTLKIAYIFYDNPAGREPLPILEALQKQIGFELKIYAVPPPGLEMGPQVLEIARQYHADWVISHLFGRAPGVSMKEFTRVGFPRDRIISFVWGDAESDVKVAGVSASNGLYGIQFAGVGEDFEPIKEIKAMYAKEGKPAPKSMEVSVYYNRGVLEAALHVKAYELAMKKKGPNFTSEDVRDAMQTIHDFGLGGLLPPLNLTAKDHEGGGWVQVWQVREGKYFPVTSWYQAYPQVLEQHVYGNG